MHIERTELPRAAVGAVIFKDDSVLLVKRKNPPAKGMWAVPGGKIKFGEHLQNAVEREVFEETGLVIKATEPVYAFDYIERESNGKIQFHYVIIDFLADYISGEIKANADALDARWVKRDEIRLLNLNKTSSKLLKERFEFY